MTDEGREDPRDRPENGQATERPRPTDRDPSSVSPRTGFQRSRPAGRGGAKREVGESRADRDPRRGSRRGSGAAQGKPGERARDPLADKAAEIAKRSGLPLPLAQEVAAGTCTLNEALRRLMRGDKADRLVRAHGLSKTVAMAVVDGKTTLEAALLAKGLEECEARQPDRSVLLDLRASGQPGCFFAFGEEPWSARVTAIEKYEVVLAPEGTLEERKVPKHSLRFVAPELVAPEVQRLLGTAPEVASLGLGPSTSYRDRFRSSKRILYAHHRDRVPTRVVLRDGTVLTGFVGWFGKWEFELELIDPRKAKPAKAKPVGAVVIFRHALQAVEPLP